MNTHGEYRHHNQSREALTGPPASEEAPNHLARHRDPSLPVAQTSSPILSTGVAWVRPTELAAYSAPTVGRGIDLQSELVRRARRTPVAAARGVRRHLPRPSAPTPPGTPNPAPAPGLCLGPARTSIPEGLRP